MFDEHRYDDDPKRPTNLPDDFDERATKTFTYTKDRMNGLTEYVKPQTEEGYPDYELMLDMMGVRSGVVFDYINKRHVVRDRRGTTAHWDETYHVPRGAFKAVVFTDDPFADTTVVYSPGTDHGSVLSLWESYIHGDVDVVGNIDDL